LAVIVELTGDEAKLWRAQQRVIDQATKLESGYKKVATQAKGLDKTQSTTFGSGAVGKLGKYLAGVVSITAALAIVRRGLIDIRDVRLRGAEQIGSEESERKRLIQIAGGSKEKLAAFHKTADQLVIERGIGLAEALNLVFEGTSLGLSQSQIRASGRFKAFASDIQPLFQATAGLRAAFGKDAAGGSIDANINALLAGAEASKVDVVTLSRAVLGPAQSVKKLGGTAEETIAAVSVAAIALKSSEEAETAVGRLSDVLARDRRFKGLGLEASIDLLASFTEAQRDAVIGENVRAKRGAGVLIENIGLFKRTLENVNESIAATGTIESRINQALALVGQDPTLVSLTIRQRAAGQLAISERNFGNKQLLRDAASEAIFADLNNNRAGFLRRVMTRGVVGFQNFFGMDAERIVGGRPASSTDEFRNIGIDIVPNPQTRRESGRFAGVITGEVAILNAIASTSEESVTVQKDIARLLEAPPFLTPSSAENPN